MRDFYPSTFPLYGLRAHNIYIALHSFLVEMYLFACYFKAQPRVYLLVIFVPVVIPLVVGDL